LHKQPFEILLCGSSVDVLNKNIVFGGEIFEGFLPGDPDGFGENDCVIGLSLGVFG